MNHNLNQNDTVKEYKKRKKERRMIKSRVQKEKRN